MGREGPAAEFLFDASILSDGRSRLLPTSRLQYTGTLYRSFLYRLGEAHDHAMGHSVFNILIDSFVLDGIMDLFDPPRVQDNLSRYRR